MELINKIKEVKRIIKETKKSNLEEIINSTKETNEQIEEMFFEVVSKNEFSTYRLELLNKKINLLETQLTVLKEEYKKYGVDVINLNFWRMLMLLPMLALCFIKLLLLPGNQFIYWIILGIYYSSSVYTNILLENYRQAKEDNDALFKCRENTIVSCKNVIKRKLSEKKELVEQISVKQDCNITLLANELISEYLENNSLEFVSAEVEIEAIKILQVDLQTEETELYTLLQLASEKMSDESLKTEITRRRINKSFQEK